MAVELLNAAGPRAVVAEKLRRIGRAQSHLERLQAELGRDLDAVRRRYDSRVASLQNRTAQLRADLEAHCRAERRAILPPGRKSLSTPFGEVGFRKAEPAIRLREGFTDGEVCRMLRQAKLDHLVRVKDSPDKQAVRKALSEERVNLEQLAQCGLEAVEGLDRFHCKIRQDALVEVGRA